VTEEKPDLANHNFLIVDDMPFLRATIQGMLRNCKAYDVSQAADGSEAMKILSLNLVAIDCVLCDWNMAPIDGLELLRAIRTGSVHNTPRDLCFIMITGHADVDVVKTALAMDANGYIVKPLSVNKLVMTIKQAFANPKILKPVNVYESMGGTDHLAAEIDRPTRSMPSWALWSAMRGGEQQVWTKQIDDIRSSSLENTSSELTKKITIVNKQRLDLSDVTEGKMLAEDIFTEEGKLLLAYGTRLTRSLINRLSILTETSAVKARLLVGDIVD